MFDATSELLVRSALASQAEMVPNVGQVIPSPLYFLGREDYWATVMATVDTREEIDMSIVAGLWIFPLQFADDTTTSEADSPLINIRYGFYLFRQYELEREDETDTPDDFSSKVLAAHNDFVEAWLGLKASFQGNRTLADLDGNVFVTRRTTSMLQNEFIQNDAVCQFVPGVVGFAVTLEQSVQVKLQAC